MKWTIISNILRNYFQIQVILSFKWVTDGRQFDMPGIEIYDQPKLQVWFACLIDSRTVVVLNSYPLIKEAFSRKEFSGRPNMFSGTFFQKGKTGGLKQDEINKERGFTRVGEILRIYKLFVKAFLIIKTFT